MSQPHVVVVGGGIAGLAAAYRLITTAPEVAITLIEADGRLGGKIVTERVDGFVIEGGPDSLLSSKPRGIELCQELGLGDQLQGTNEATRRTFVLRRGRLHQIPEGLTGLVPSRLAPIARTGLLSPRGKLRLALDYVLPPRREAGDESLAAFVERRLGREVYARLVEPLMSGIYAGDGRQLSLAATFPQLREGEQRHGGLIKGVLAAKRQAPMTPSNGKRWPPFVTPRGGMAELVERLEVRLRAAHVRIMTGTPVTALRRVATSNGTQYELTVTNGTTVSAESVIVATPAFVAADLLAPLDRELANHLASIPHVSTATVSVAYPLSAIPRLLTGYGYVVPRAEGRPVLACTWVSGKWAHRAPSGHGLIRVFIGRAGDDAVVDGADAELLAIAHGELRDVLGIRAVPELHRIFRWPRAMPQPTLGHLDRVAAIEGGLTAHPGLALAGNAYRGIGIPDCIRSGEAAATLVADVITNQGRIAVAAPIR